MQPVPEAVRMQPATKYQLRYRVLDTDFRHHARSGGCINYVGHHSVCSNYDGLGHSRVSRKALTMIRECRLASQWRAETQSAQSDMHCTVLLARCRVEGKGMVAKERVAVYLFGSSVDVVGWPLATSAPTIGQS